MTLRGHNAIVRNQRLLTGAHPGTKAVKRKQRRYYTLLAREPGQPWCITFGDYDRSVVVQEGDDMKDGSDWIKGTKLKIIETGPNQADIEAAVAELNGRMSKRA